MRLPVYGRLSLVVIVSCFCEANDNGRLEFLEFCEIISKFRKTPEHEEEELRAAFRLFDRNDDGHVDREELLKVKTRHVLLY